MALKQISRGLHVLKAVLLQFCAIWWFQRLAKSARHAILSLRDRHAHTTTSTTCRQLLVDVSIIASHDAGTGIQRVVRSLLVELLKSPPPGLVVRPVKATRKHTYLYANRYLAALTQSSDCNEDTKVRAQSGDIFLGLDLTSRIAPRRHVDFLTWRTKGVLVAFVAYDMLPILNPKWFTPRALKSFRHWLSTLAVHADSILCISESVAADTRNVMRNHFDLVDNDITIRWFHLGAHFSSRHTSTSAALPPIRKRRCGPRSVDVLMVGTVEPRKGYSQVIDAFDLLWTNGVDATLTIAGKQGWCVDVLAERITEHPEYGSRLFWRSQIDDIELAQLYSHSDGLIMASEAEGFGLPLIEAARFGTPVLARDLRVFREVAGEHAEYFHGRDGVELMPQLATWLVRLENGVARSSAGMTSLTWSQSANQLRALLAELKPRAEVDSASHEFIGDASL